MEELAPAKGKGKDVDKQSPINNWVSIVLIFSTLTFSRLLTLLLLFSLRAFYNAEQRSKRSGEGGAMGGGWAQAEGRGQGGIRAGLRQGDTMDAADD